MKTTFEISYKPIGKEKFVSKQTSEQAINQILQTIESGLHQRGIFIRGGYPIRNVSPKSNSISLKLDDLKYQYLLNLKVLKSNSPTQVLIELQETFQRPEKLSEPELIQIRKTYEILKDSFLFSKNLYLYSETTNSKLENYRNRIIEPNQCHVPLTNLESIDWQNIEDVTKSIQIIKSKHERSNFDELTIKSLNSNNNVTPIMFWYNHRGKEYFKQFENYKYHIQNYIFRYSDLIGSCLNLTEDQIEKLENRILNYGKTVKIDKGMWMGTDGDSDEFFIQTEHENMILIFKNIG